MVECYRRNTAVQDSSACAGIYYAGKPPFYPAKLVAVRSCWCPAIQTRHRYCPNSDSRPPKVTSPNSDRKKIQGLARDLFKKSRPLFCSTMENPKMPYFGPFIGWASLHGQRLAEFHCSAATRSRLDIASQRWVGGSFAKGITRVFYLHCASPQ